MNEDVRLILECLIALRNPTGDWLLAHLQEKAAELIAQDDQKVGVS